MSPWIQRWGQPANVRSRLFCFPHAGGAATAFRLWPQALPPDVEVLALQLPGRGNRWKEPALRSIPAIVEALLPAMQPHMDRPFAFFGHSMGSMVAYAATRELERRGGPVPSHLFVSARRPARIPNPDTPMHTLSDEGFVAEMLRRYGGIPKEVLAEPDLMALLLPSLRADMEALETYHPEPAPPLALPVTAYGGTEDPRTPREHLEAWRAETGAGFQLRAFAGGHFYLEARRNELLSDLGGTLERSLAQAAGEARA